jgi:hypothetical protein
MLHNFTICSSGNVRHVILAAPCSAQLYKWRMEAGEKGARRQNRHFVKYHFAHEVLSLEVSCTDFFITALINMRHALKVYSLLLLILIKKHIVVHVISMAKESC